VIIGGESESLENARPMEPEWARAILDECRAVGVAPFVKQLGSVLARRWGCRHPKGEDAGEWPADLRVRELPGAFK
jgi:protein gp37